MNIEKILFVEPLIKSDILDYSPKEEKEARSKAKYWKNFFLLSMYEWIRKLQFRILLEIHLKYFEVL